MLNKDQKTPIETEDVWSFLCFNMNSKELNPELTGFHSLPKKFQKHSLVGVEAFSHITVSCHMTKNALLLRTLKEVIHFTSGDP